MPFLRFVLNRQETTKYLTNFTLIILSYILPVLSPSHATFEVFQLLSSKLQELSLMQYRASDFVFEGEEIMTPFAIMKVF